VDGDRSVRRLLREKWAHRRRNAPGIAKVCGAGGGGCVFFLVERGARDRVAAAIEREGAQVLPVRVAPRSVRVRAVA
jgi:D-glycero-alpha-D-manno-heptose-7-phosphate kinase